MALNARIMSLRSILVLGAFGAGVTVAAACGGGSATGATCPPDSTLTYETFGKAFFEANCNRCHSAKTKGESPLYDDVTAIRANAKAIDEEAASGPDATNEEMPDDGDIPKSEREKLGQWLACGAP